MVIREMGMLNTHTYAEYLHINKKIRKINEMINYILDTLSTEYTPQVFTHASRIFHRMCSMRVILHNDDNEGN